MSVLLQNVEAMTWVWHDAKIYFFTVEYKEDGEIVVSLRCLIHPEEDRKTLLDLNIQTPLIDIEFHDTTRFQTIIHGNYSRNETVDRWSVIHSSPIIDQMNASCPGSISGLLHHHIMCSSGSSIDVICGEVRLAEVEP